MYLQESEEIESFLIYSVAYTLAVEGKLLSKWRPELHRTCMYYSLNEITRGS